jgi:uncharacterized protein YkwD
MTPLVLRTVVLSAILLTSMTAPAENRPFRPITAEQREEFVQRILELTNAERTRRGLSKLKLQDRLGKSADWYAAEMAKRGYFSHTDHFGRSFDRRISSFGYPWRLVGENIAFGYDDPCSVVQAWMESPGHRANILEPRYREIGISVASDAATQGKLYWVQNFGAR